eukprot:GEMP01074717.1.p2 GENE.GEMP01074717.1~~GEMP01074717.1.p2  ORF type:complete len:120 (+),score=26.23 GEMP01074717.1:623-982(+)
MAQHQQHAHENDDDIGSTDRLARRTASSEDSAAATVTRRSNGLVFSSPRALRHPIGTIAGLDSRIDGKIGLSSISSRSVDHFGRRQDEGICAAKSRRADNTVGKGIGRVGLSDELLLRL